MDFESDQSAKLCRPYSNLDLLVSAASSEPYNDQFNKVMGIILIHHNHQHSCKILAHFFQGMLKKHLYMIA